MQKTSWPWVFLILILSFFSFKSLLRPGYFPMHDDMQAMRVLQMDKCVKDGQIPCRWVPDMGYEYGYPQFIFYSPLPYYVMEGFHLLGFSFLDSVKAGFALSFILSGLTMFLLGKALWGNLGGFISAIFYIYAPYRASDAFSRGAVGEFWALVFLPLIAWSILEVIRKEKIRYLIFLAFSFAGLLITHNLTVIAFTPVAVLWGIFLLWYYKKWRLFTKLFLGSLLGVGLASFFVLPLFFERKFVHIETMTMGYFNFLAHFVSLRQIFLSTFWGYGSSELGPYDDLSFSIGIWHWLLALLVLIISFLKRKRETIFSFILFFFLIFLGSCFMAHQNSVFIWNSLPFMKYFQFPWRFLTIATFAVCTIVGAMIPLTKGKKNKIFLSTLLVLVVILFNAFYFNPSSWYNLTDKDKFSGELWEKQLTISIFDYLPIFAQSPPVSKAPEIPLLISGEAEILNYQKGTDWQRGKVFVTETAVLRLPLYYFPGFKVWIDGRESIIDYHNDLGLITISVPPGEHEIYVKLKRTWPRAAGDFLTIVSLILVVVILYENRHKKDL